jgi:5-methylcytosine-specific restriction endonuclease McrA
MSKDAKYRSLINTSKWRKLRLVKLHEQPLCERCEELGKVTPATEVHHVIPVETAHNDKEMEGLAYNINNLMSVCHSCHKAIHQELLSHTKENIKKANERRVKRFIDRYL